MENDRVKSHIKYIFIDESGDLGKHGSKYFTIIALSTHELVPIQRILKRVRQRILNKKLKDLPEIKANNSTERIRKYVLKLLNSCECSISSIVIPKHKSEDNLFIEKDKLYNYLCGMLFEHIDLNTGQLNIIIDKKHSNRLLREDFNDYIVNRIKSKSKDILITIKHLESHSSNELQAADFVAWAVNRKYTYGDSSYYDIIKPRIRNQGYEELWR